MMTTSTPFKNNVMLT